MKMIVLEGEVMRVLEIVMVDILVVMGKEMINKGEMVGLALGVFNDYGSPRKEKMIWICFGERILRGRE